MLTEIKGYDTTLYVCDVIVYIEMYLSRFKTNSVFHSYDTRNKSDLFITSHNIKLYEQSITMVCLFITNCLLKLKVLSV